MANIQLPQGARDLIARTQQLGGATTPGALNRQRELQAPEGIGSYMNEEGFPDASVSLSILFNLVYGPDAPLAAQTLEQNVPDPKIRERVMKDLMRAQEVVQRTEEAVKSGQMDKKAQDKIITNVKATVREYINPYASIGKVLNEGNKLMEGNLAAIGKHQQQYQLFEKNLSKQENSFKETEKRIAEIDRKIKEADERPPNEQDRKEFTTEMKKRMEKLAQENGLPNSKTGYAKDPNGEITHQDIIRDVAKQYGIPEQVMLGQWAAEGRTSGAGAERNNPYNLGGIDSDPLSMGGYETFRDGVEAFAKMVSGTATTGFYGNGAKGKQQFADAYAKYKNDPEGYIKAIEKSGYAGDPKTYAQRAKNNYSSYSQFVMDTPEWRSVTPTPTPSPQQARVAGVAVNKKDREFFVDPKTKASSEESKEFFSNPVKKTIEMGGEALQGIFKRLLGAADDVMPKAYASDMPSQQLPASQKPQENDFFKKYVSPFSSQVSSPFARIMAQTAPIKMPSPQVSVARTISRPVGPSTPAYATPANANASSTSGRSVYIPPPTPKPAPRQTFVSTPQKSVQQKSGPASRASGAYPVGNTKTGRILYSDGSIH